MGPLTPKHLREKCIELYKEGKNYEEISEITTVKPFTVRDIIKQEGITEDRPRHRRPVYSDDLIRRCIKELRGGATYKQVCGKYKVSSKVIKDRSFALGISLNLSDHQAKLRERGEAKLVEEVKELYYNSDLSIPDIGNKLNLTRAKVEHIIRKYNFTRNRLKIFIAGNENEIIQEYLDGLSFKQISDKYGYNPVSLSKWFSYRDLSTYLESSWEEKYEIEKLILKGYGIKEISDNLNIILRRVKHTIKTSGKYKECFKCKNILPRSVFSPGHIDSSDGLNSNCKECYNAGNRQRRADDPYFRLVSNLRGRVKTALGNTKKVNNSIKLIGCSVDCVRKHLESQFRPNMTWKNYGKFWHIDHIIPLDFYDLNIPENQYIAFHYTNMQPLWATTEIAIEMGEEDSYIGNLDKNARRIKGGIYGEQPV